jgi:Transposase DDE domain
VRAKAAAADAAEDARYGDAPGAPTPRALARRAERRERLARARDRLAAEDTARRDAQRAKQDAWDAAAVAGKPRSGRRLDDEPRANRAGTGPRADITDPDVRVMRNQKGYAAGYNGQLAVTADQVIVGAMLSRHPGRPHPAPPASGSVPGPADPGRDPAQAADRARRCRVRQRGEPCPRRRRQAAAARAAGQGPRPAGGRAPNRARHLEEYPATARAIRRLRHPRGREDYKLRARTVEPVFGQLKACQRLAMMSRRGLAACESEWLLACAAHNLRKLHRHRLQG